MYLLYILYLSHSVVYLLGYSPVSCAAVLSTAPWSRPVGAQWGYAVMERVISRGPFHSEKRRLFLSLQFGQAFIFRARLAVDMCVRA